MEALFGDFLKPQLAEEVFISLILIGVLIVFCFVVFILVKRADPLAKPKGLLAAVELGVEKVDAMVEDNMGKSFPNFGAYVIAVALFIFLSFIIGIMGLPNPLGYIGVPFTMAMCTFVMIHATSIKYTKWKYFKRYTDPVPVFLPINLLSMWAPLLSLTLRLFGNALAGWVLLTIVYWALGSLSNLVFASMPVGPSSIIIAPLVTPVLHAYFDVFSGAIQTLVFMFLSMLFVAQEKPEEDKVEEQMSLT